VLASVTGSLPSDKVVALRADMDALPIQEKNAAAYASQSAGVMHACGHDAHTASLLGTASILQRLRNEFGGTIKLLFQPAEEKLPGGATRMIAEGALQNPAPIAVIGQHVFPGIEAGKIAIRKGRFMASMDEIFITVHGRGGHAAQPHQNIDPVVISAQIILALQQLVSRFANPSTPSVLSIGKVIANGAINVIPDEVYMEGTFRTMDEQWRGQAHEKIVQTACGIAETMGGSCTVKIIKGYPCLVNNEGLADNVQQYAEDYLGKENVLEAGIWMAAEDFAYYSQQAPSCFYLLGVGNAGQNITSSLHTPTFNIDENALLLSTGLMAWIAVQYLEFKQSYYSHTPMV
jgi:amidohydrolase